jgi:hypothetical protein
MHVASRFSGLPWFDILKGKEDLFEILPLVKCNMRLPAEEKDISKDFLKELQEITTACLERAGCQTARASAAAQEATKIYHKGGFVEDVRRRQHDHH